MRELLIATRNEGKMPEIPLRNDQFCATVAT